MLSEVEKRVSDYFSAIDAAIHLLMGDSRDSYTDYYALDKCNELIDQGEALLSSLKQLAQDGSNSEESIAEACTLVNEQLSDLTLKRRQLYEACVGAEALDFDDVDFDE